MTFLDALKRRKFLAEWEDAIIQKPILDNWVEFGTCPRCHLPARRISQIISGHSVPDNVE